MPLDSTTQITVFVGAASFKVWDEGTTGASFERNGFNTRGTTHWRCAYADAVSLAQALLGGSKNIGTTTVYQNGFSCPAFYGLTAQKIFLHNEGILSRNVATGFGDFERVLLEIQFGYDEFAAGDAQSNTGELAMDYEFKEYPLDTTTYTMIYSGGSGEAVPGSQLASLTVAIGRFEKVLYNRAIFNTTAYLPYIHSVNATPINFGSTPATAGVASFIAGRGQIYFAAPRTRTKLTPTGLPMFDLIYDLRYHPIAEGWNSLPKPDGSPTIWTLVADGNGDYQYPYAELNDLFRF